MYHISLYICRYIYLHHIYIYIYSYYRYMCLIEYIVFYFPLSNLTVFPSIFYSFVLILSYLILCYFILCNIRVYLNTTYCSLYIYIVCFLFMIFIYIVFKYTYVICQFNGLIL